MTPVSSGKESGQPPKQCCCCGAEFDEAVPSYAVICEHCVNLQDEYSQCS